MSGGNFKFEWDAKKASSNKKKHGVSFEDALGVFNDPLQLHIEDKIHSHGEHRLIVIGRSIGDRILLVIITERADTVRIISARKASLRERYDYEENR